MADKVVSVKVVSVKVAFAVAGLWWLESCRSRLWQRLAASGKLMTAKLVSFDIVVAIQDLCGHGCCGTPQQDENVTIGLFSTKAMATKLAPAVGGQCWPRVMAANVICSWWQMKDVLVKVVFVDASLRWPGHAGRGCGSRWQLAAGSSHGRGGRESSW